MRNELPHLWWSTRVTTDEDAQLAEYVNRVNANLPKNTRKQSKARVIRDAVALFLSAKSTNRVAKERKSDK